MQRKRGLSWDNARRYVVAGLVAAMLVLPGTAFAKAKNDSSPTVADGPVEWVVEVLRSVSWS